MNDLLHEIQCAEYLSDPIQCNQSLDHDLGGCECQILQRLYLQPEQHLYLNDDLLKCVFLAEIHCKQHQGHFEMCEPS